MVALFSAAASARERAEVLNALAASWSSTHHSDWKAVLLEVLSLLPTQPIAVVDSARRCVHAMIDLQENVSAESSSRSTKIVEEIVLELCRKLVDCADKKVDVQEADQLLAIRALRGATSEPKLLAQLELAVTPILVILQKLSGAVNGDDLPKATALTPQVTLEAAAASVELARALALTSLLVALIRQLSLLPILSERGATIQPALRKLTAAEEFSAICFPKNSVVKTSGTALCALARAVSARSMHSGETGAASGEVEAGQVMVAEEIDMTASMSALLLLEELPLKLQPQPSLARSLDEWADGATEQLDGREVGSWRATAKALTEAVPVLAATVGTMQLHRWLVLEAGGSSSHAESPGSLCIERLKITATVEEEEMTGAKWLVVCNEMMGAPPKAVDPLSDTSLRQVAEQAWLALVHSSGLRDLAVRQLMLERALRLLDRSLTQATTQTHRTRRLMGAMCSFVCGLGRPHLSAAQGSFRMLPLLLSWADRFIDVHARALALQAVRHCVESLASIELVFHEELLTHTLMRLTVFRQPPVLEQLLPSLILVWERLSPTVVTSEAKCKALLDVVCRELAYVASMRDVRVIYLRELPRLFRLLQLELCSHLEQLIDHVLHLIKVELNTTLAAMSGRVGGGLGTVKNISSSFAPLKLGLKLLHDLLWAVWPRVGAHALLVTRHVLTIYMRVAALMREMKAIDERAFLLLILPESCALLRMLRERGAGMQFEQMVALLRPRLLNEPMLQAALDLLVERVFRSE